MHAPALRCATALPGIGLGLLCIAAGPALLAALPFAEAGTASAGPLTVDSSEPQWLVKDGAPFYFCGPGDPENFLHRGTRNPDGTRNGDQDAILQEMTGTGANILWMTAVRSHGGDGGPTENPFVNNDPNQGIGAAVLDQWEGWISQLDAAGIVTFFVFYDDGARVWNTGDTVGAAETAFFTALVNRFEEYDRVIWCPGEEYEEAYSIARFSAIASLIASVDGAGHPIAGHQHEGTQFHFADDPSFDAHAMHCGPSNTPASLHSKVLQARNFAAGRYHVIMAESIGHYAGDRTAARKLSWAAAMGGATVMVHGLTIADTPPEALEDCGRLCSFFASVPFGDMTNADPLRRAGTEYVFGGDDAGYVLYASNLTGSLGFWAPAAASGPADLRWFDPASGAVVHQPNVTVVPGDNAWPKPVGIGAEVALSVLPAAATGIGERIRAASWGAIKARFAGGEAAPRSPNSASSRAPGRGTAAWPR